MAKTPTTQEEEVEGLVEVEIPETLPTNPNVSVQKLYDIGFFEPPAALKASKEKRGLMPYPMLKVVWEPQSFELDRNPDNEFQQRDGGPYNCNIEWYSMYTNDGMLFGPTSLFGQFHERITEITGVKLTKNSVFRPELRGLLFTTERKDDPYIRRNPDREDGLWVLVDGDGEPVVGEDGKFVLDEEAVKAHTRHNYFTFPVEKLDEFTPLPNRRVIRVGYGGSVPEVTVSDAQLTALKEAMNGKSEEEYADALFDSAESDILMVEPFMSEVADGTRMTARLVKAGGKVVSGRVYFE